MRGIEMAGRYKLGRSRKDSKCRPALHRALVLRDRAVDLGSIVEGRPGPFVVGMITLALVALQPPYQTISDPCVSTNLTTAMQHVSGLQQDSETLQVLAMRADSRKDDGVPVSGPPVPRQDEKF